MQFDVVESLSSMEFEVKCFEFVDPEINKSSYASDCSEEGNPFPSDFQKPTNGKTENLGKITWEIKMIFSITYWRIFKTFVYNVIAK